MFLSLSIAILAISLTIFLLALLVHLIMELAGY